MRAPSLPPNEADRLADLHDFGVLDTPSEKVFNEFAELAAAICGTQYAAVTLIDRDRQWFKAEYGLAFGQTTRDESVCGHAILENEVFEVPDTERDERFANNPVLTNAGIRFYCGSQLRSDRGHAIGMLCVLDSEPRQLSLAQRHSLDQLADVMMAVLEAGRQSRMLNWFGALVDTVADEILVTDPQSLRYLYANPSAVRSLGYSLEQLRGMTPMDVMKGQNHATFNAYVRQLQEGAPQVVFEGVRQRSDGGSYPVEARWQLVSSFGRPVILSIVTDITQRKEMERMKSEFISVVSHELRTPLTSIHGAVKLLDGGMAGVLPEGAARLVTLAARNSERLRTIVDDILDMEKMASGQMTFQIDALDVAPLLERAAQAFEAVANTAGVRLAVSGGAGLHLRADAQRLHQVLANLISNALKFAPKGSQVRVEASQAGPGSAVRLQVTDQGPGIPDEFRGRIFQRFAQAQMTASRPKGGSGLGLSIAKEMVEHMGGRIGYDSVPGCTVFHVTLPPAVA
ncbi:MAG: ATP-binding protein [Polaromonas sp.]|uniref:GAF domain-containing sensor histidine kinase n=1 Tax=Polaromonas sp. TaxID=1869339 RepID=UPI002487992D|nr:ATP-binding protein [Polaromonas sp.]MDI1238071.1 ATP-binding protein [Polaromonas sp.]